MFRVAKDSQEFARLREFLRTKGFKPAGEKIYNGGYIRTATDRDRTSSKLIRGTLNELRNVTSPLLLGEDKTPEFQAWLRANSCVGACPTVANKTATYAGSQQSMTPDQVRSLVVELLSELVPKMTEDYLVTVGFYDEFGCDDVLSDADYCDCDDCKSQLTTGTKSAVAKMIADRLSI